ncbi:MAG: hypothetical protein H6747_07520 [Deltaproteobacteria bacterium]|nr:hypothetical protein [Deltaproteobacteria bacterium]
MSPDPRGDWLVRVAGWGRQSVHDAPEGKGAELVFELDVAADADVDAVLDLAVRWQRARHHGLLTLRHASASSDRRGARICWLAPAGSNLFEVSRRAGPIAERAVAALLHDLLAAIAHAHARELVVGRIAPGDLFLAPPGSEGIAAVRVLAAGLPGLLERAGATVGALGDRGFAMLYDDPRFVAPEVLAGRAPTPSSDVFAIAATACQLLLCQPAFPSQDERLLPHAMAAGPSAELAEAVRKAAPLLAGPILAALSPSPLQRAGALADLRAACAECLGDSGVARVSIVRGGGPWEMGSPIVPLAAWAGSGAYADRFGSAADQREAARTQAAENEADPRSAMAQAKLDAALRELDVRRAVASGTRRRPIWIDLTVVLVVAVIAAAVVWLGARGRDAARSDRPSRADAPWNQPRAKIPRARTLMRWPKKSERGDEPAAR